MIDAPTTARAWLDHLLEPGWTPLFDDIVGEDPLGFPGYADQIAAARTKTGASESVLVGDGILTGTQAPTTIIAFEFGFLGGSMGAAAGERICRAFEHAAARTQPIIALTASGGARMQEGMHALATMPATINARAGFAGSGAPFLAYLRSPTTGGVFASFASTADLIWAEPGATIGFAGPRVAERLSGEPLPEGSHTAESARDAGLVDRVVAPAELGRELAVLGRLGGVRAGAADAPAEPGVPRADAHAIVEGARSIERAAIDWTPDALPLRTSTESLRAGITWFDGMAAVAMQAYGSAMLTPDAFADARRAITIAEHLRLPVVTFVNTPGADPRAPSERAGIAREIAATFEALLAARVPTVACVTGVGGSGGALALAACDRLLILEGAVFSVIAPDGAASILKREDIAQVAADLRLTAHDLRRLGLADLVVAEPPGGAPADPARARALAHQAVAWALGSVDEAPSEARSARWRTRS